MEKYVGYVRTSTGRQTLGLGEQKSRIDLFIQSSGDQLIEIVVEQESGRHNQRKGLDYALDLCLKNGYTLLFTKLDRLSREVEFLFTLKNRGVKLRCIELPDLNTLTLGIFGSVAQWERELISTRTKNALNELKKRGIKLGSPQNLTKVAREKGTDTIKQNRQDNENWRRAITYIEHYQMKYGQVNYSEISRQLNQNGYKTRNGCSFCPGIVRRLVKIAQFENYHNS
jgi:DNA invertase Pin-like site-specific DNA recombinase